MGLSSSSKGRETKQNEPSKPVVTPTTPLIDKETLFSLEMSKVRSETKRAFADHVGHARLDLSAHRYDYARCEIPKDRDGYVVSFSVDEPDKIRDFFEKYGVVVVRGCLDAKQAEASQREVWDFVERRVRGVRRDDPSTWNRWVSLSKIGILGNDAPLSPQLCDNRQNPYVHAAFAAVFGSERLLGAVSRLSMFRPTKGVVIDGKSIDKDAWRTHGKWVHWDMDPFTGSYTTFAWAGGRLGANGGLKGYDNLAVQGILALRDCGPKDGGFCCVPGFHKHVKGWANANADKYQEGFHPGSFFVPKDDPLLQDIQTIPIRQGSVCIWDSRLPHCSFPNKSDRGRMVQYVKMCLASDDRFRPVLKDRAFLPSDGKGFHLTQLGARLYGFEPWPKRDTAGEKAVDEKRTATVASD